VSGEQLDEVGRELVAVAAARARVENDSHIEHTGSVE
jgi:hypothetical protein